jgi:hypothetical protein
VKKGRRILVFLLPLALVSTLAAIFWPREREPVYHGKKLSEWLETVSSRYSSAQESQAAENAIRQIGTNALPCLVKWISYDTPAWRKKLLVRLTALPGGLAKKRTTRRLFWDDRRQLLKSLSVTGFRCLGPAAAPAVPELSGQLNLNVRHDDMSVLWLMTALSYIGKEGLAPLLTALTNQPPNPSLTMIPAAIFMAHQGGGNVGSAKPAR